MNTCCVNDYGLRLVHVNALFCLSDKRDHLSPCAVMMHSSIAGKWAPFVKWTLDLLKNTEAGNLILRASFATPVCIVLRC